MRSDRTLSRIPISPRRAEYHPEYKTNLMALKRFVMIRFLRDTTVIPNISSVRGRTSPHLNLNLKQLGVSVVHF